MTDKSYFRTEKNENIAARDKARAEELAKEPKNKKSELDDPSHWRYKKNKGIKHGTTTMADIFGKKEKEEHPVNEDGSPGKNIKIKKATFTEKFLFDQTKAWQVTKLKELKSDKIPKYEKDRVALILKLQG